MRQTCLYLVGAALLVGCNSQPYLSAERLDRGLIVVLPGIEGRSPMTNAIAKGLADGGIDWAIEIRDWTSPLGPLYNLRAEQRNREQAQKLARHLAAYREDFPDRPVVLVGHSGGAAIAAWAAEALPGGTQADGIIMLAPALSPPYLLDLALSNLQRGIVNFYSARDRLFLALGTTVYGTMDGQHSSSAGHTGFEIRAAGGQPAGYERLFQIGWRENMSRTGHRGTHLTSSAAGFVAIYVVPFVLSEEWNEDLVASMLQEAGGSTTFDRPEPDDDTE